jgi:hypothetical protein
MQVSTIFSSQIYLFHFYYISASITTPFFILCKSSGTTNSSLQRFLDTSPESAYDNNKRMSLRCPTTLKVNYDWCSATIKGEL